MFKLSVFTLLLFPIFTFSNPYMASTQTEDSSYTCKMNSDCLELLNIFLDKEDNRGIYQYCQITYDNIKQCCMNPLQCQEYYGKEASQELRSESLSQVEQSGGDLLSCELSRLSGLISSLSGIQSQFCEGGVKNCKSECEGKLEEFKQSFRECFSVPQSLSIEEVLEKAKTPSQNQDCYREMREIARRYKDQSLNKQSKLREKLKAKDIVNCKEIERAKTRQALNSFALSMCHQAQVQKQEKEEAEREKQAQIAEQERVSDQSSATGMSQSVNSGSSNGKSFLDAGALTGVGTLEVKAVSNYKEEEKYTVQQNKPKINKQIPIEFHKEDVKKATWKEKTQNSWNTMKTIGFISGAKLTGFLGLESLSNDLTEKASETNRKVDLHANPLQFVLSKFQKGHCKEEDYKISKVSVYQSVESPQIENNVFTKSTFKDRTFSLREQVQEYDNYDLVQGKPIAIVLSIDFCFSQAVLEREQKFSLSLKIDGDMYEPDCLRYVFANDRAKDRIPQKSGRTNRKGKCEFIVNIQDQKKELEKRVRELDRGIRQVEKEIEKLEQDINYIQAQQNQSPKNKKDILYYTFRINLWNEEKLDLVLKTINIQSLIARFENKKFIIPIKKLILLPKYKPLSKNINTSQKYTESRFEPFLNIKDFSIVYDSFTARQYELNKKFSINFLGFDFDHCGNAAERAYSTSHIDFEKYMCSEQIKDDIYDMFPFNQETYRSNSQEICSKGVSKNHLFKGKCNKSVRFSYPFYWDLRNLLEEKDKRGVDRLVMLVTEKYMEERAKEEGAAGVIFNYKESGWLWKTIYPSKIALVTEDTVDKGTVLHELAHAMKYPWDQPFSGAVEFYGKDDKQGNEIYTWCKDTGVKVANCKHYVGSYSFSAPLSDSKRNPFRNWGLVDRKVSIMADAGLRYNKNKGWIDRDSYQRALSYLYSREPKPIYYPPELFIPGDNTFPPRIPLDKKVIGFSFFYNPSAKENNIVEQFKAKRLKLKHNKFTKGLKESFKGSIEMKLLDERGQVLKQNGEEIKAVFPHRMALKFIPREGSKPVSDVLLDVTPICVVFPIPEGIYSKEGGKSLQILIRAIDEEGNIKEQRIKERNQEWREI